MVAHNNQNKEKTYKEILRITSKVTTVLIDEDCNPNDFTRVITELDLANKYALFTMNMARQGLIKAPDVHNMLDDIKKAMEEGGE